MAKYYSYQVLLKGVFHRGTAAGGPYKDPWTYNTRAPDAETAKLTASRWYQQHKTPMGKKPRTLVSLMSKMTAKRVG